MSDVEYDYWSLALKIHDLSEVGSREFQSSSILANVLRSRGFEVEIPYLGIPTAFRAEKTIGTSGPTIAFLAEYDALPGIGHACGHNLIASAAVFSAIETSRKISSGRIVVIGTPDEEGSGEFSGSKIIMTERGAFKDVDIVLGSHPGDSWSVGDQSLAVQDFEVTFFGYSAHEAGNPEKGKSALNGSILTYEAVNMMRQHVRRDANVVMHAIISEGGTASNVTPERSVLKIGIRSSDLRYLSDLISRFKKIVEGCAIATETTFKIEEGPLFSTTKINKNLSNAVRDILISRGIDVPPLEKSISTIPTGSTDFANVSQVVPALELSYQIAEKGTPWHSRLSLEAAKSEWAKNSLAIVIDTLSEFATRYAEDEELRRKIREDFLADREQDPGH
ncbi:MAG: M20 family metallopeptidase [Thermoplasmata archaeon]